MRRLGRTVVLDRVAKSWRYQAKAEGSQDVNLAGNCQSPRLASMVGVADEVTETLKGFRPRTSSVIYNGVSRMPVWLKERPKGRVWHIDAHVRCRRCETCLRAKARHWRLRAQLETRRSSRTWFGTLTMTPELHARAMYEAIRKEEARGNRWDQLTAEQRWRALTGFIRREWQLYMKRLRKSGAKVRYLLVIERHSGGGPNNDMPHLHTLIHEQGSPVRHRTLKEQWTLGFTDFKLVDDGPRAVAYVCKYLTKDICNRPFASLHYGASDETLGSSD